LKIYSARLLQQ